MISCPLDSIQQFVIEGGFFFLILYVVVDFFYEIYEDGQALSDCDCSASRSYKPTVEKHT